MDRRSVGGWGVRSEFLVLVLATLDGAMERSFLCVHKRSLAGCELPGLKSGCMVLWRPAYGVKGGVGVGRGEASAIIFAHICVQIRFFCFQAGGLSTRGFGAVRLGFLRSFVRRCFGMRGTSLISVTRLLRSIVLCAGGCGQQGRQDYAQCCRVHLTMVGPLG